VLVCWEVKHSFLFLQALFRICCNQLSNSLAEASGHICCSYSALPVHFNHLKKLISCNNRFTISLLSGKYNFIFICLGAFLCATANALALKGHWGYESCVQQSEPGHPTLPQSWEDEEEVRKKTDRNVEQADECERRQQQMKQRGEKEGNIKTAYVVFSLCTSIHTHGAMNTHLMSWLYLARRSERQGAPVLIWNTQIPRRVTATSA